MSGAGARRWPLAITVVAGPLVAALAWWTLGHGQPAARRDEVGDLVQTVARGRLPAFATGGDLPALYRFAAERQDVLSFMPCFCGCGDIGHTSNRACYIKAETARDTTFTSHAAT
ncbi:MAG: hypothetical protein HY294_11250 [Candidatus Rokubacteria bacterium]|nr:hypothetical protein [Candidatus Rokubacteria bacterium]MBI3826563.1 hypothetical protein [Candidatus Rokubacteria bacterium]